MGISIGNIAAALAIDTSISYAEAITGLVIYALFPIVLSLISMKSYKARGIMDGKPTILISNGKIIGENLKKAKLNINDLLEQCRAKDVFDIADIEFAILETSGNITVDLKAPNKPVTAKDMNIPVMPKGLCVNLIIDGKILEDQLQAIGKDKAWIGNELRKQNILDPEEVLLGYMDGTKKFVVQKKDVPMP